MMAFSITELLDEQACYEFLVSVLHPTGLQCPASHRVAAGQAPHMSDRAPVVDYRCRRCGKVFNVFTNAKCTVIPWKGSGRDCGISSALFVAPIKSTSRNTWPSSNGRTT